MEKYVLGNNDYYVLQNGVRIPKIGFGTLYLNDEDTCIQAIKSAIQCGYRHIDTSPIYENESFIGTAMKECQIKRDDLFITSKLWNDVRGYDKTIQAFENTCKCLGVDYIDLYLIHWPNPKKYRENWAEMNNKSYRALEDLYKQGRIKAIGVSNFYERHLQALIEKCEIKPMINQIKMHPGIHKDSLIDYCLEHQIQIESYSPLGRSKILSEPVLLNLSERYGKSPAQIVLRWQLEKGYLPLPRSSNTMRMKQNIEIFDFILTAEEIKAIDDIAYDNITELDDNPDIIDF